MGRDKMKRRSNGPFVMVLHSIMNTPAWHRLSGNGVKLLLHLMKLSENNNGWGHGRAQPGELSCSERQAADAIGVARNTASRAFEELIELGFLRPVQQGYFHVKIRLATTWRLTFQPYPRNHQGPTNEYRNWRPEEKPRAQKINGTGAEIEINSRNGQIAGSKIVPVDFRNRGKPPSAPASDSEPHIDMPRGVAVCDALVRSEGGH